ncbi:ubiquinone biosynthesis methyltransferase UbiE [Mariprofundus ferrooxydans]|uniref:Ubiquinone/menaquinone biosynthesis C-methyltransferase UbiE n=2 Tax=Mariprofundus ferrooxydans TaxID=314344 RepID=Q0F162_9PROT|nr:Ubiquinone/menaquinone biosynthesis methyltransferase [Mariprofundus ferrooxydans PV-1]KON47164.1 ubiquinone biosynthesis methyltransferase UbiE [Mariprofundus ferrooxydans]
MHIWRRHPVDNRAFHLDSKPLPDTMRNTMNTTNQTTGNTTADTNTHFGYETVSGAEKVQRVMGVFSSVASQYDIMNDLMSGGMHRLWKRRLFSVAAIGAGSRVLDVAAGSGDIAIGLSKKMGPSGRVVLTDLNGPMLAEGARRVIDVGLLPGRADCIQSDGTKLAFADNSFDCVTIAFGIRNFLDIEAGLAEFYRVLKPGGQFICLEFSRPVLPLLDVIYDAYSFNMIPLIGEKVTGDRDSYQYLVESIRRFPDQERFAKLIRGAGFEMVKYENMTGGIVALHRGYKI